MMAYAGSLAPCASAHGDAGRGGRHWASDERGEREPVCGCGASSTMECGVWLPDTTSLHAGVHRRAAIAPPLALPQVNCVCISPITGTFCRFRTMATASASAAAAPALASGLASKMNGVSGTCIVVVPAPGCAVSRKAGMKVVAQAAVAPERVPDMGKRNLMNLLLLGAVSLPSVGLLGPYLYFLVPPGSGSGSAGVNAKDALGNDITMSGWLKTHPAGDRTLAQGLKGDPTYLVVENDGTLATYGVNAVCTHLGCVVPWNKAENKFMCPCHGSQYDNQGKVVRGPAPLSLALAHVDVVDDKVLFSPWPETDFRTGEDPWWS